MHNATLTIDNASLPAVFDDREAWLTEAASMILDEVIMFAAAPHLLERPPIRVSCGWPVGSRGGAKVQILGQCFARSASTDGTNEIFIAPTLDDPATVLLTLAHELIHAVDDCDSGHKGRFAAMAKAVGFEAPLTQLNASEALAERMQPIAEVLGRYPHARLDHSQRPKQTTRNVKVTCGSCDVVFRASRGQIRTIAGGLSQCPACGDGLEIDGIELPEWVAAGNAD